MTSPRIFCFVCLAIALLTGCDEDPVPSDAGDDARIVEDGGGPPPDTTAPRVVSTSPRNEATSVDSSVPIFIRFSEPMDSSAGAVALLANDAALAAPRVTWSTDGFAITVSPTADLPQDAAIAVTLSDFEDPSGNALVGGAFGFETGDRAAPRVTSSAPAEGAADVAVDLDAIEITFDEGMDEARGHLVLEGGAGTIGELAWAGATVTASLSGLAAENEYTIRLVDFTDRSGNLVDPAAYLGDGAIDFTTGTDDRAPTIAESDPMEGQLDVSLAVTTRLGVRFSERMDTTVGTATLTVGGASTPLPLEWQDDGAHAILNVTGLLAADAAHAVTFTDFADLAGNALDTTTYLVDGALDFTTGEDSFVPFVAFSSPQEGEVEVATDRTTLVIVFSERMSTELDTIVLRDTTGRAITRQGTWAGTATYLTVPLVPGDLLAGFSYSVDLRAFQDLSGSSIDDAHGYLADGILQFTTVTARTGEACGDPLTVDEATESDGVLTWTIESGTWTTIDGVFACDWSPTADGLIYYRKTTPSRTDGGTALRVRAESSGGSVEIYAGTCGVGTPLADAARQRCLNRQDTWETFLDVGPGDYFIWVADGFGLYSGGTVTIEETATPTEGEGCGDPYDVMTAAPVYTAPTTAGDPHVWTIPAGSAASIERTVSHRTAPLSCSAEPYGSDAVVRFDKTSDTSFLVIEVENDAGAVDVEISDTCDARVVGRAELGCFESLGTEGRLVYATTLSGPSGPRFVWLNAPDTNGSSGWTAFAGATVRIAEVEPSTPGDSCANAIAITPGTSVPVTADRPHRVHAPSCLDGGVTWYRYTVTERLGIVRASNGAGVGSLDSASLAPIQCRASTLDERLPVVAEPGTDVCIAVASNGPTTLAIDERPYTGVVGRVTDMAVTEPEGAPFSVGVSSQSWITATPSHAVAAAGGELYYAPEAGGVDFTFWDPPSGLPGDDGVAIGETLYLVSNFAFSPTTRAPLVYRVAGYLSEPPVLEPLDVIAPAFPDGGAPDGPYPIGVSSTGARVSVPLSAITAHGSDLWVATDTTTVITSSYFFTVPIAGGEPVQVGVNDTLQSVSAIAVDEAHVYVVGNVGGTEGTEGIWRLSRAELSDPSATPVLVYSNGLDYSDDNGALYLGAAGDSKWLYFRSRGPSDVHLLFDVDTASPIDLGRLWTPPGGPRNDNGLGYDPTGPRLYLIDTSITSLGHWYRID